MKLLFICQHYYPERIDFSDVCKRLVEEGHDVTVLTGLPNYRMEKNRIPKKYRHRKNRIEKKDGVIIIRCTEFSRRNNFVSRLLNYASFYFSSLHKVKKLDKDFDRVICYQYSPITMASCAVKYAKKNHCPLILYCFDLWPESVKTYNIGEKNLIYKLADKLSKNAYQNSNIILVTSKPFIEYFTTVHKIDQKKIIYLPQFSQDYSKKLKKVKKDGKIHLLYAGNIGKAQNVRCIIEAIELLKTKKDYIVDIVGDGSECLSLINLVNRKNLEEKIIFHGEKSKDELLYFYSLADALLLTMKDDGTYVSKTLPLKTQSYMSTRKPILASINGAAKEVINEYKCGYCVDAGDVKAFATIIENFIDKQPKINYRTNDNFLFEQNYQKLKQIIERTQ